MKQQEEKRIYDFKRGDIITRIKPIIDDEGFKDYNLVGRKVIFQGIANASIYLAKETDMMALIFMGMARHTIQLPLELAEDGWAFHIEPDFLENDAPIIEDEEKLQKEIERATEIEDFEKADKLKKKLEELKNKNDGLD